MPITNTRPRIIFTRINDETYISKCKNYTIIRNNAFFPKNVTYSLRKNGVFIKSEFLLPSLL